MLRMIHTAGKHTMHPMNKAKPVMLPIDDMSMPCSAPTIASTGFHFMTMNTTARPVIIIDTRETQRWVIVS